MQEKIRVAKRHFPPTTVKADLGKNNLIYANSSG